MVQIGRYQVVEELGRGAAGVVYKARDPKFGRMIAIKTIRLSDLTDPAERGRVRERLLREAQSAVRLSHPNIVTVYDVLEEQDLTYIFMEYVSGRSLGKLMRSGTLPERALLLRLLRQVAGALDYAHHNGVVHRDIKPGNVMITDPVQGLEPYAKIIDFGVAKFISQEMTHSGAMLGTPNYMSPEQVQGTLVDARSDQFSFGVLVYELLSGAKPFAAENVAALFYLVCREDPKPVQELNLTLNEEVDKVLRRALSKLAEDRFGSCTDFIAALSSALDGCGNWHPQTAAVEIDTPTVADAAAAPARKMESYLPEPMAPAAPSNPPYAVPAIKRRRRDDEDDPELLAAPQRAPSRGNRKWLLAAAILIALAGAAAVITRWKPPPDLPVQVLDTKSGEIVPPPKEDTPSKRREKEEKSKLQAAQASAASFARQEKELAEIKKRSPDLASPAPSDITGNVDLLSEPPGAKIVVDGSTDKTCTAPCTITLPNGRHTLEARTDGYNVARRVFNLPHDDNVFVQLNKSVGVLMVTTNPAGAQVFVDGKELGVTPATLHLSPGTHRLALVSGYRRHEETVEVVNDGFMTRFFRLDAQ